MLTPAPSALRGLALGLLFSALSAASPRAAMADEARLHDGLLARFALGVGGLGVRERSSVLAETGVSGSGPDAEIQVGGSLSRHVVLAGALSGLTLFRPSLRAPDGSTERLNQTQHLVLLAPSVDVYLDPSKGFHFGAGFGGAWLRGHDAEDSLATRDRRRGVAGSLWVGHEWFVSDQWSLGALVRASGGRLWAVDRLDGEETSGSDRFASLSLGFSALLH